MKKIFIVVPNWNGQDFLGGCLKSLTGQTLTAQVVVVDNGSTDESIAIIEKKFPDIHLIKLPRNKGFAGGVNAGICYALEQKAEAIALFNNDAVAEPTWLEQLVAAMGSDNKTGIVSCKQLRNDRTYIDSTGDFYSIWGMPFPRGRNHKDNGQYDNPEEVFSAPAGATLYNSRLFEDIGLFDEAFFAYLEDVDISFRAQLAGWKVRYEPKAIVYHHVGATSSKLGSFSRYHFIKNFYMLYSKNMPGWLCLKYLPLFTLQAVRLCLSAIIKGGAISYFQGTVRAFLNTPHVLRERHRIQKNRQVSPRYIDSRLYKKRPPRIPTIS